MALVNTKEMFKKAKTFFFYDNITEKLNCKYLQSIFSMI